MNGQLRTRPEKQQVVHGKRLIAGNRRARWFRSSAQIFLLVALFPADHIKRTELGFAMGCNPTGEKLDVVMEEGTSSGNSTGAFTAP